MSAIPSFLIRGRPVPGSRQKPWKKSRYSWKRITGTSHAVAGTQTTHAHGLGRTPIQVLIEPVAATDTVYTSAASDATNISVKSLGTAVAFVAWVL
jgi:hypothetical protein